MEYNINKLTFTISCNTAIILRHLVDSITMVQSIELSGGTTIDKCCDHSSDIDYSSKTDVIRDVIYLIINQCELRRLRMPLADTKCPPAAQCKQAKRA